MNATPIEAVPNGDAELTFYNPENKITEWIMAANEHALVEVEQ